MARGLDAASATVSSGAARTFEPNGFKWLCESSLTPVQWSSKARGHCNISFRACGDDYVCIFDEDDLNTKSSQLASKIQPHIEATSSFRIFNARFWPRFCQAGNNFCDKSTSGANFVIRLLYIFFAAYHYLSRMLLMLMLLMLLQERTQTPNESDSA